MYTTLHILLLPYGLFGNSQHIIPLDFALITSRGFFGAFGAFGVGIWPMGISLVRLNQVKFGIEVVSDKFKRKE